jgi:hypothetical protein
LRRKMGSGDHLRHPTRGKRVQRMAKRTAPRRWARRHVGGLSFSTLNEPADPPQPYGEKGLAVSPGDASGVRGPRLGRVGRGGDPA